MEYTEEVKKAIKAIKYKLDNDDNSWFYQNEIETIIDLLEKQQKEIERLKEHKKDYTKKRKNYISLYKLLEKHLAKEKQNIEEKNNKIIHLEKVLADKNKQLKNSIPKEAIREKMKQLDITDCTIRYDKYDIQDILRELLGE